MPRLFIAISIDPPAAHALLGSVPQALITPARSWRIADPARLHLTLLFMGDADPRRLDDIMESVERSAAGLRAFTLTADRLSCLPEHGDPRVLAAFTDAQPDMLEIQRRAFHRLATREQRKRGNRFKPHITLARASTPEAPRLTETCIDPVAMEITDIRLFRSDLRPAGPVHTLLHSVTLRPAR